MHIRTKCTSCGFEYTAPASFAGRSVKCRNCGAVFELRGATEDEGGIDLSAIEASLEQDAPPLGDGYGGAGYGVNRTRMERTFAEPMAVAGAGPGAVRRTGPWAFPGGRELDQFVPWIAAISGLILVVVGATAEAETSGGASAGRVIFSLLGLLLVMWPAAHTGLKLGLKNARVMEPPTLAIRSLAAASVTGAAAMLLWSSGSGGLMPLVLGLVVGLIITLLLVWAMGRLLPHELPTALTYSGFGLSGGVLIVAILAIALNALAGVIAKATDQADHIGKSPIAQHLKWPAPAKPADPVTPTVARKPDAGPAVPEVPGDPFLIQRAEQPLPRHGFMVSTGYLAPSIALVNDSLQPAALEVWSTRPWKPQNAPTAFTRQMSRGMYRLSPDGRTLARITQLPRFGIESVLPSGQPAYPLAELVNRPTGQDLVGFVSPTRLLVRSNGSDKSVTLSMTELGRSGDPALQMPLPGGLSVENAPGTVQIVAGGQAVAVAGRRGGSATASSEVVLIRTDLSSTKRLSLPVSPRVQLTPTGIGATTDLGFIGLLIAGDGELFLYTWSLSGSNATASGGSGGLIDPLLEVNLGSESLLRGSFDTSMNPLVWLDVNTLLLFGRHVVDATTGRVLRTLDEPETTAVLDYADDVLTLVRGERLVQLTLKPDGLKR